MSKGILLRENVYDDSRLQKLHEILLNDPNVDEPYQDGANTPVCYPFKRTMNVRVNRVIIRTNCIEIVETDDKEINDRVIFTHPIDAGRDAVIAFVDLSDLYDESFGGLV